MDRSLVTELHYMTPLANLQSIAEKGILSHENALWVPHASVAMESVQDRRSPKSVPGGRPLHCYVNLYFDARNAMMRLRRSAELVVVRVRPAVLDLPGVVIADGNAANGATRFLPSPHGLAELDGDRVYARWWTSDDYWEYVELKRQRQAEVLVPDVVPPDYIVGCYAWQDPVALRCRTVAREWQVEVNPDVYFD